MVVPDTSNRWGVFRLYALTVILEDLAAMTRIRCLKRIQTIVIETKNNEACLSFSLMCTSRLIVRAWTALIHIRYT
jgi:hypothetical protein